MMYILMILMLGLISNEDGDSVNMSENTIYSVHYAKELTLKERDTEKEDFSFDLEIFPMGESAFTACYSKDLTSCLYNLKSFRTNNIALDDSDGVCFTYSLDSNSVVKIKDKEGVILQLEEIKSLLDFRYNNPEPPGLRKSVDLLILNDKILNINLTRELSIIHAFSANEVERDIAGIASFEDTPKKSKATEAPMFLDKVDWTTQKNIHLYKHPLVGDNEFKVENLHCTQLKDAKKPIDLKKISLQFFDKGFEVQNIHGLQIEHSSFQLKNKTKELTHYLKEIRNFSDVKQFESSTEITQK